MGIFSFVKPGKQVFKTITSIKPNVPKTKSEKLKSNLAIARQKTKGSKAKLNQAIFNLQEQNKAFKKDFIKDREKKMGGGMMGRRMGYKGGKLVGNQKKIDVAAPFGTINEKDFAKLRTNKKGNKNV